MLLRLAFFILPLAFIASAHADSALNEQTPVKPNGLGPVFIGMTPSTIIDASGMKLTVDKDAGGSEDCFYDNFTGDNAIEGVSLLIQNNRLSALTVYNPNITNAEKIGIGSTVDDIEKTYAGKWSKRPNPYGDPGDDDIVVPTNAHYGYVFFINNKKVHYYSAGILKSVQNLEGCS